MSAYDQMVKDAIITHYKNQRGGGASQYPIFRGAPVQYGNGIGDIFRAIGRFLLPIFASSAKTFVRSTAKGIDEGHNLKDSAKQALRPTVTSTVLDASDRALTNLVGSGRRGRKRARPILLNKPSVYKAQRKQKKKRRIDRNSKFSPLNF